MHGSLAKEPLPELIHELERERQSGVLQVRRDDLSKRIYFGRGAMVFAASDLYTDRLGEHLVRQRRISRSQLAAASNRMRASGSMLGKTLVSMGILGEKEMKAGVESQVRSIIYSLFSWDQGQLEFESKPRPVKEEMELELPSIPIILEGIRRVQDAELVRLSLGDLDRVVSYSRNPWVYSYHLSLTPQEAFVLSRVDGQSSLSDIVSITPLREDETLQCLYGLVSSGFLEFGGKSKELRPKEPRKGSVGYSPQSQHSQPTTTAQHPEKPAALLTAKERLERATIIEKLATLQKGTYYHWLGVDAKAKPTEIRRSYSELVKQFHPDRYSAAFQDMQPHLEAILAKLMEAYGMLSDPSTRRRYDNTLRTEAVRGESLERHTAAKTPTSLAEGLALRYYREASRSYDRADFHRTVELMTEAVELDPKPAYHRLLAKALAKNPKWRKNAEEHFQEALNQDPCDIECYLGLGELYEHAGLTQRAEAVFSKALELDPTNEKALALLGRTSGSTSSRRH